MPLTSTEDGLVTSIVGGPAGDNDARRAMKKWGQQPPDDTCGSTPGGITIRWRKIS